MKELQERKFIKGLDEGKCKYSNNFLFEKSYKILCRRQKRKM